MLFKNNFATNPFLSARLKIMGLYFVAGVIIFVILGWFLGYSARKSFYTTVLPQNDPVTQEQINLLEHELLVDRIVMFLLFAVAAYGVTDITLRPLRKSSELQKNFIAIASHELRTPVTIIKNAAEVALRDEQNITKEKAVGLIKNTLEETNRLAETIQFLLTFSTLQSKLATSEMEKHSLSSIVEKTVSRVQALSKNHTITYTDTSHNASIVCNPVAIDGMLTNLLRNALLHSPFGNEITVRTQKKDQRVELSIEDHGQGIDKEDIPYIFEPFYRGKNTKQTKETHKGVGLGLSIVKTIVELHKGSIAVHSKKNTGTTFSILFPFSKT